MTAPEPVASAAGYVLTALLIMTAPPSVAWALWPLHPVAAVAAGVMAGMVTVLGLTWVLAARATRAGVRR